MSTATRLFTRLHKTARVWEAALPGPEADTFRRGDIWVEINAAGDPTGNTYLYDGTGWQRIIPAVYS